MASLYHQERSPYYWIRYYDPLEPNPNHRRKSINTKIEISTSDRQLIRAADKEKSKGKKLKIKLEGNRKVNKLKRELEDGIVERKIKVRNGIRLVKKLKLSDGYKEFKKEHTIPGDPDALSEKTLENYTRGVDILILAAGDKLLHYYTEEDYKKMLTWFEVNTYKRGKKDMPYSQHARSAYIRPTHSLFQWFIKKKYLSDNPIGHYQPEEVEPDPIPLKDLFIILKFLNERNIEHFKFIYFLLLSFMRPSSAMVQEKEWIHVDEKYMKVRNVKAKKKKKFYNFPLYKELILFLREYFSLEKNERLFYNYKIGKKYTDSLKFWDRNLKLLEKAGLIRKKYQMKQLRSTSASYCVNVLRMSVYSVQKLLDHSDIKLTQKHYALIEIEGIREDLDNLDFQADFDALLDNKEVMIKMDNLLNGKK